MISDAPTAWERRPGRTGAEACEAPDTRPLNPTISPLRANFGHRGGVGCTTAAQAEVDKLGDAPTCPSDGSQKDVDEAITTIRDHSENLRSATSGLDAAAKVIGGDAE